MLQNQGGLNFIEKKKSKQKRQQKKRQPKKKSITLQHTSILQIQSRGNIFFSNESKVQHTIHDTRYMGPIKCVQHRLKYIAVDRFNLMQIILGISRAVCLCILFFSSYFRFHSFHTIQMCTNIQARKHCSSFYFQVIVLCIHFEKRKKKAFALHSDRQIIHTHTSFIKYLSKKNFGGNFKCVCSLQFAHSAVHQNLSLK